MPTDRFYRLPETKKRLIREAATKEFARVPFEKASINQIIQNADISRGSFYTYFEDKQDVVRWLFEDSCSQMRQLCKDEMEKSHGDYFSMLEALFEYLLTTLQTADMLEVAKNVFSYQENAKILGVGGFPSPEHMKQEDGPVLWIYRLMDHKLLRKDDLESFAPLLTMGMTALMCAVKQYYDYPDQLEQIREMFRRSLDLLRYGAYRKED